jgi:hypothetical protein
MLKKLLTDKNGATLYAEFGNFVEKVLPLKSLVGNSEATKIYITGNDADAVNMYNEMLSLSNSKKYKIETSENYSKPTQKPDIVIIDVGIGRNIDAIELANFFDQKRVPTYIISTVPSNLEKELSESEFIKFGKKPITVKELNTSINDII